MQRFVTAIRKSIDEQNWFAALFLALAVPDICGALEQLPTGKRGKIEARYCKWFNKYLKKYDPDSSYDIISVHSPEHLSSLNDQDISFLKTPFPKSKPPRQDNPFTAQDCYRFRCKCLHQGLLMKQGDEKFIFIEPPPRKNIVHGNSVGLYQLQIDVFCEDICLGVEQWFEDVKQNQAVISGMQELIQISPYDILSPWIKFE